MHILLFVIAFFLDYKFLCEISQWLFYGFLRKLIIPLIKRKALDFSGAFHSKLLRN